jgi:tetratricopeptide (TPR) repeat protein
MATKAKTAGSTSSAADRPLEDLFSKGVQLMNAGKPAEAIAAFQQLESEASAQGQVAMARSARIRIMALRERQDQEESKDVSSEMSALIRLNRQEPDEALKFIEKALKTRGGDVKLHYLKAIALAQKGEAEASAAALGIALQSDANLVHLFRSERDFDQVRGQAPFASFELA